MEVREVTIEAAANSKLVNFMEESYIENVRSTEGLDIVEEVIALADSLMFDFNIQATPVTFNTTTGERVIFRNHITGEKMSEDTYSIVLFGELALDVMYADTLLNTTELITELMELNPNLSIDQDASCWIDGNGVPGIPTLEGMRDYRATKA